MKGICDVCGHYSKQLEYDSDVGLFVCQKCLGRAEREVQRAFEERARKFNGKVVLYPDERW